MASRSESRTRRRWLAWIVLIGLLCAAPGVWADGTLQRVLQRRVLRVGMTPGVVPFVAAGADAADLVRLLQPRPPQVLQATDGRPVTGFDVELAADAARYLGVRLEIVLVEPLPDLLPGLQQGRYDVVLSAVSRTLDRALSVAFSDPYFASGLQVLSREPARFPTLDALKRAGLRVGALAGTTAETFARGHLKEAQLVPLRTEAELFQQVALPGGRGLDAVVVDYVTARDAAVRQRLGAVLAPIEERRFTTEHFAMATRQGDADWLRWLNLFLFEIRTSGAFHRLAARYNPWFRSER